MAEVRSGDDRREGRCDIDRTRRWRWWAVAIFPLHALITAATMGLRPEHLLLDGVFLGTALAPGRWRRLSMLCFPFFLTAIAYDNLRFLTPLRGPIHIADLYGAELRWFGIETAKGRQILPEFFRDHPSVALDLACGFAYLAYLYEVVLLSLYLFFTDERLLARLTWAFLLVNLVGIVTYLAYPAAPPWYVERYGLGPAVLNALPSAAGAARFDALLGISYFQSFYARNPNVFGAMPSLHAAYPTLVCLIMFRRGRAWALGTAAFAGLVAFSALYLRHHYVFDVLVGVLYAGLAYGAIRLHEERRSLLWRRPREEVAS